MPPCLHLKHCTTALAAAVIGLAAAASAAEPIVTTDLLRIRTVPSIDVTGDGLKAVYAVRSIAENPQPGAGEDAPASYGYRSHLFVLDLFDETATPRQLTFGDRHDGSPVLSPDGRRVAFTRAADVDIDAEGGRPTQVWVMSLDGGEARPVTAFTEGARSPRWSPDGRRLLVHGNVSIDELDGVPPWPSERPRRGWAPSEADADAEPRPDGTRAEIRAWLDRNSDADDPAVINRLRFQGEQTLRDAMSFTQLFLVDPDDADAEPRRITWGFHDHRDGRFSPDGRSVVFVTNGPHDGHPDRVVERNLGIVDLAGGEPRTLLAIEGMRLDSPRFGPGGETLAFAAVRTDEPVYRQRMLGAITLRPDGPGEPVWLTDEEHDEVWSLQWLPARSSLLYTTARQGGYPLMIVKPGRLDPAPLIETGAGELPVGVTAFAAGGGTIVYAVASVGNPCVLHVVDARAERVVHDLNPWVADRTLSTPRSAWLDRPDGTRVQYWIMEPTDRQPGRRYPLCLAIHGGPSAMWGPGEDTMWHEFQLLCSWGYGVVYGNPRGSGGYGRDFLRGNFQNWGAGPAGDVLAVCDVALREPWVDRDELVVTGGSYAGYLTAWIVAHDHRFKAAVAQRGVYDLQTFFGEGNAWELVAWAFGGQPWDPGIRKILTRESPFTYANRIRTPLLIMHGSRDLRTGVSQSAMLFRALKVLDRPVEYVRYPEGDHELSRSGVPVQRMDRLNRIIEFFERYVDNPRPAPTLAPGPGSGG